MTKNYRQGQILKLIRTKKIGTQEELARELKEEGIETTQVTLSRDIRELGLAKTADGYREILPDPTGPSLAQVMAEYLLDVRLAQNMVILKTSTGSANSLAVALDQEDWAEVAGTVAGDDTVLVVCWDNQRAKTVQERLLGYVNQ
ncbi:arginine repressor [Paludibaculum fermentans]|uniref:Arginine repressor n=1 Tax=Paludibaculum fermentans TaxID=1473598 RepID=A0A7S7SKN5_PALFE|nr:ArgR family transcriptional regulator [Paludibaculum fermentans]QOY89347.1 ArgR family transcriptional regulator [Paludibaculum fermentans]